MSVIILQFLCVVGLAIAGAGFLYGKWILIPIGVMIIFLCFIELIKGRNSR